MLGDCGKGEEAEDLGSAGLKSLCRIRGVGVERRLRFLRQYQRKNARAARRGRQTPTGMPTSRPMLVCLVLDKVEPGSATLLVAKLKTVPWLPSEVTICVTVMLGLLEPAVDRLLLEVSFIGVMLVENV